MPSPWHWHGHQASRQKDNNKKMGTRQQKETGHFNKPIGPVSGQPAASSINCALPDSNYGCEVKMAQREKEAKTTISLLLCLKNIKGHAEDVTKKWQRELGRPFVPRGKSEGRPKKIGRLMKRVELTAVIGPRSNYRSSSDSQVLNRANWVVVG